MSSASITPPVRVEHIYSQFKSLLLSHHHSTCALVSEILESVLQTVQKQFTCRQYILTDLTRRQCAKYTYIYSVHTVYYLRHTYNYQYTLCTVCTHFTLCTHIYTQMDKQHQFSGCAKRKLKKEKISRHMAKALQCD